MAESTIVSTSSDQAQGGPVEDLLPLVYEELRRLAAWYLAKEKPGQTLQPTALVHEAWLRLAGAKYPHWQNRAHFFGVAAEAMRRILVENARSKQRLKRGGQWERVALEDVDLASPTPEEDLVALDGALKQLAQFDPRAAEVVKLCFFVGLTHERAATELGVSLSTVERNWTFDRAWLFQKIEEDRLPPHQLSEAPEKGTAEERRVSDKGACQIKGTAEM
jgi:RNA polymerase sigma factor (TIGR02999 family)